MWEYKDVNWNIIQMLWIEMLKMGSIMLRITRFSGKISNSCQICWCKRFDKYHICDDDKEGYPYRCGHWDRQEPLWCPRCLTSNSRRGPHGSCCWTDSVKPRIESWEHGHQGRFSSSSNFGLAHGNWGQPLPRFCHHHHHCCCRCHTHITIITIIIIIIITSRIWLPDLEIMDLMSFQTHKILSKLEGKILTRKGLQMQSRGNIWCYTFSNSVTAKSFVSCGWKLAW